MFTLIYLAPTFISLAVAIFCGIIGGVILVRNTKA